MSEIRWERRGMIQRPVIEETKSKGGRPRTVTPGAVGRMVDLISWTPETLRAAHAAYERGNRDVYTLAGQREYNRLRGRTNRRGMSATDLAWAERNAVKFSWELDTRANRCVSVVSAPPRERTTMNNQNPHMLPANVRDEYGIPISETVAAMQSGELATMNPALGFLRRTEVLAWIATR